MPSLVLTVFAVQLIIHLVNTLGASTINSLLWSLYNRVLTATTKTSAEQKELKAQFLKIRKELNATSSQDEFAKWAKLRRQHDKLLESIKATEQSNDSFKATFDQIINTLRWLGTSGLRLVLNFWFQKTAMFWLPKGWVPYYAEWLLSFPRAPMGSVSIQAWSLACAAVVLLFSDAIVAVIALVFQQKSTQKGEKVAMKVPAESGTKEKAKKEL